MKPSNVKRQLSTLRTSLNRMLYRVDRLTAALNFEPVLRQRKTPIRKTCGIDERFVLVACRLCRVSRNDVAEYNRHAVVARARKLAMWGAYRIGLNTYESIGEHFQRNHAAVMSAVAAFDQPRRKEELALREAYREALKS